MSTQPKGQGEVCLVTGVGPGTGTAIVERFLEGGYQVAMLARDEDRLEALVAKHEGAHAFPCDVGDLDALGAVITRVQSELGPPKVVVHNAYGATLGSFREIETLSFEQNFRINASALLLLAQRTADGMIASGGGALLATGNTSAYRGKAAFAGFAPTKAAQRILIESIARAAGPEGLHAAYIAIDAVIDVPWTRQVFKDQPDDFFCQPKDIASECFHVAHQPKSSWSSEVVIRPFTETW